MLQIFFCLYLSFYLINANCPAGSYPSTELNACFSFDNDGLPFKLAALACTEYPHGHLVSLNNAFENNVFMTIANKRLRSDFVMLGLTLVHHEWKWQDDSPPNYFNWAAGEPANDSCVVAELVTGKWRTVDCGKSTQYSCKVPQFSWTTVSSGPSTMNSPTITPSYSVRTTQPQTTNTQSLTSTTSGATVHTVKCAAGWILNQDLGMCYLHGRSQSFDNAEAICTSKGGHLASIHNDVENNFVAQLGKSATCSKFNDYFYGTTIIGGTIDQTGTVKWLDGSESDYPGTVCKNVLEASFLTVQAFPEKCTNDCKYGNWSPISTMLRNVTLSDFVCKTTPI